MPSFHAQTEFFLRPDEATHRSTATERLRLTREADRFTRQLFGVEDLVQFRDRTDLSGALDALELPEVETFLRKQLSRLRRHRDLDIDTAEIRQYEADGFVPYGYQVIPPYRCIHHYTVVDATSAIREARQANDAAALDRAVAEAPRIPIRLDDQDAQGLLAVQMVFWRAQSPGTRTVTDG